MTTLAFDTTALSHFARAERTDTLRMVVADDEPILLAEVATELARGVSGYPSLGNAAAGGWLKEVELEELQEIAAFRQVQGGTWGRAGKKQRRSGSARLDKR